MTQSFGTWLMAAGALVGVVALMLLLGRVARATGLGTPQGAARRLAIVETVTLDARRRAVLLRCDGREVLLLLGSPQDSVIGWMPDADRTR